MKTIVITTLAVALLLAGCSSKTAPPASSASVVAAPVSTSAAPASSSTPSVWTTAEAGQQYLTLIKATNADGAAISALPNTATLDQFTTLAKKIAADIASADQALMAGRWPTSVQPQITALESAALQERAVFEQASASASAADFVSTITGQQSVFTAESGAAEAVRLALGLPSN